MNIENSKDIGVIPIFQKFKFLRLLSGKNIENFVIHIIVAFFMDFISKFMIIKGVIFAW